MMRLPGWIGALAAVVLFAASPRAAQPKTVQVPLVTAAGRQPAVAIYLKNGAGKTVSLSDFKGQVVAINLWATNCGGCRAELPAFVDLHKTYGSKGLTILGVSMDVMYDNLKGVAEAWTHVTPFVSAHGLDYAIVVDDGSVENSYKVMSLPATYLVDRQGRLAAAYAGVVDPTNLEGNIRALLAEGR